MPSPSPPTDPAAANQPWLLFFRRVRVLAAKLDALEAERDSTHEE